MKKNITLAIVLALATLTACGKSTTPTDTVPVDTTVVETTVEPTVEEQVEEVIDEVTEPVEEVTEPEVEEQVEVTEEEPTEEPSTEVVEEPVVTEPTYTVTYFAEPKVMYCQEFSNFRVKPEQNATVSYTKNTNATVTVVGTCTENGWYYIEDGAWTLASNLGDNEVVVATAPATTPTTPTTPANSGYPAQVQEMLNNGATMDWEFIDKFGNPCYRLYNPSNGWYYDYGTHPSTGEFTLDSIHYVDPAVGSVYVMMYSPDFGEIWY